MKHLNLNKHPIIALVFSAVLGAISAASFASDKSNRLPIATFKNDLSIEQVRDFHKRFSLPEALKGQDITAYAFLNIEQFTNNAVIKRSDQRKAFELEINPAIGDVSFETELGKLTLNEFLQHPNSYAQGYVVVHKGKIVYEQYPGMNVNDNHMWASVAKPTTSLVISLLEAEGKVDLQKPFSDYVTEYKGTVYDQIPVIDVMDMATGLNLQENDTTRSDPNSIAIRTFKSELGYKHNGKVEALIDVLKGAKKQRESGVLFEYGSSVTQLLVLLAEAIENKPWPVIFEQRVWSKLYAEGDLQVTVTPQGVAAAHGIVSGRLRDIARFGMLYTPSWSKAAKEDVVTDTMISNITQKCRPDIYPEAFVEKALTKQFKEQAKCNSRQWDAVFADGDLYKGGLMSQGLYVSPSKDLVIAWFSTSKPYIIPGYSRQIAKMLEAQ